MIKYLFLDLDDTILDFHKAEEEALKKTLEHFGVTVDEAALARYSEINISQWKLLETGELTRDQVKLRRFQLFFEEYGITADAEDARLYYENSLACVKPYFMPDAERVLRELAEEYELYLVSNGTTHVQNGRVGSAGIAPLFKKIYLSEAIGYVKPQREFFDICFAEIENFDPSKAIILGDSLTSDILGGINAGIRTCWYHLPKDKPRADIVPDHEVTNMTEFSALLKTL